MSQATSAFSRRDFLTQASCFGAFYHLAARVPLLAFDQTRRRLTNLRRSDRR